MAFKGPAGIFPDSQILASDRNRAQDGPEWQALKNGCVWERILRMEGERQKVKCVSVDFQAEPTILVPQTDCHLTTGASRLQHHLDSEQEQELLFTSICPFLSLPPPVAQKKTHAEPFSWQCLQFGDHFSILYIHTAPFGNMEGVAAKKHQSPKSRDNQFKDWSSGKKSSSSSNN